MPATKYDLIFLSWTIWISPHKDIRGITLRQSFLNTYSRCCCSFYQLQDWFDAIMGVRSIKKARRYQSGEYISNPFDIVESSNAKSFTNSRLNLNNVLLFAARFTSVNTLVCPWYFEYQIVLNFYAVQSLNKKSLYSLCARGVLSTCARGTCKISF